MSAPAKKPGKGFSGLMIGCLVAGVFLTIMLGLGALKRMSPDKPEQETTRTEETQLVSTRQPVTIEPSFPEMGVRRELTAQPLSGKWSEWIPTHGNSKFVSCEANDDLTCADTQSDVSKIGYAYQCKNLRGEIEDWTPSTCQAYIAVRVRSKDETARKLAHWLEPYNG